MSYCVYAALLYLAALIAYGRIVLVISLPNYFCNVLLSIMKYSKIYAYQSIFNNSPSPFQSVKRESNSTQANIENRLVQKSNYGSFRNIPSFERCAFVAPYTFSFLLRLERSIAGSTTKYQVSHE